MELLFLKHDLVLEVPGKDQEIVGRVYADEDIADSEKLELMEVIMEHAPINCQMPQIV